MKEKRVSGGPALPTLSPAALILGLVSFFCLSLLPRVLFPAILGLPLEQLLKDSPTTVAPFATSVLPSETKFSSFKKIESSDFPAGAVEGT